MNDIKLEYADQTQKNQGWVLNPAYLNRIQRQIKGCADVCLKDIEAVLLAASSPDYIIRRR